MCASAKTRGSSRYSATRCGPLSSSTGTQLMRVKAGLLWGRGGGHDGHPATH
ncbi:Uncharacterised protein [Bordetella pertussis]|nr:Uncharacterised protein [Bordetella pertussis]